MKDAVAMILAGGRGKRMDIFCHQRPKPTLSFGGKFHVIDFTLSNCLHSGIRRVAALVDYQQSAMKEYLKQWDFMNEGQLKLSVLQPRMKSYAGTADAVYQNMDYLLQQDGERDINPAETHHSMDYQKMVSFHRETAADVTVGVTKVPIEEAHRFGTCLIGSGNRITEFEEKAAKPRR